jgi:hypothetical protein
MDGSKLGHPLSQAKNIMPTPQNPMLPLEKPLLPFHIPKLAFRIKKMRALLAGGSFERFLFH